MTTSQPYQLLPALAEAEYEALRDDIEAHGIRVPVDVDEAGQILDGHHRAQIAAELGIECPTRVVTGLTEDEKREHAVAVNAHRRVLTREQRRALVFAELDRDPSRSDRAIGRICGVDHKTVGAIRRGGWGIPQPAEERDWEADVAAYRERLAPVEKVIGEGLHNLDVMVLVKLLRGESSAEVVGWLTTVWREFERAFQHHGEGFFGPVRKVIFTERVDEVLAWPKGWYGDECMRESDELQALYHQALYRIAIEDRDPAAARLADALPLPVGGGA